MFRSVFAIVVTFNPDNNVLKNQFYSLSNQVDAIIYIDNNSKNINEIIDLIYAKNSVYLIPNKENKGLGFAQNQGIKLAIENGASHVLILDHDSILMPDFILNLLTVEKKLISNKTKVAALGPIYVNEKTTEIYPITRYYGPFIKRIIPDTDFVKASFLISSGCLIRIEAIKEIGLMNEDLFVDYIDVEWSYRATSMGYSLFAVPKSKMNHTVGDKRMSILGRTISVHSPIRRYYLTRNSFHMLRMPYVSVGYKVREIIFNILRIAVFTFVSDEKLKFIKFSIKGIIDGLKGVSGEFK